MIVVFLAHLSTQFVRQLASLEDRELEGLPTHMSQQVSFILCSWQETVRQEDFGLSVTWAIISIFCCSS